MLVDDMLPPTWRDQLRTSRDSPMQKAGREATMHAWLEGRVYSKWPMHAVSATRKLEVKWQSVMIYKTFPQSEIVKAFGRGQ